MSKTFSSASLDHIKSYSVVKKVSDYALSFNVVAVLTTYFVALANCVYSNLVTKLPFIVDTIKIVDVKFDSLVLVNLDKVSAAADSYKKKGEDAIAVYKKKGEETIAVYKKKGEETVSTYLKPVNDYASSTVDKVLPKAKDAAEKVEATATNEISKSIEIVNDTLERTKDLITNKSSELSNAVISTYNKEFDAVPEKNYYAKVASASVNTGVALLKNVNSDYIQPLKATTRSYVSDVASQTKTKADELVHKASDIASNQPVLNGLANNIPVVSASAWLIPLGCFRMIASAWLPPLGCLRLIA